jgi:type VI secretion system secreted protein VgrG
MSQTGGADRLLAMTVPAFQPSTVIPYDLVGQDAISKPYVFTVRFATDAAVEDVLKALGAEVTITFGLHPSGGATADPSQEQRPLHGHFRSLARVGRRTRNASSVDFFDWEGEIVPKLWFLSQTSDFRIYQDMTVPAIVQDVLSRTGITSTSVVTTGSYGTLEYCVQYGETALDFISRLMEQAGLYYWHEHTATSHKLVIKDLKTGARVPAAQIGTLAVNGLGGITSLTPRYHVRTGKWYARDFNMLDPTTRLESDSEWADTHGATNATGIPAEVMARLKERERYRYPGLPLARVHGSSTGASAAGPDMRAVSDLTMEVEEAGFLRWDATSAAAVLDAGTKVSINPGEDAAGATDFIVTSIRHQCHDESYWSTAASPPSYSNDFECLPFAVQFRPERETPKPAVRGPQTAIVVGTTGDVAGAVRTDAHGRVKVRFAWDRVTPSSPDATSCWIRVSQSWGGNRWGHFFVPRVGDEVIVDFLEGDPDRPIITGRVHHTASRPPLLGNGGASEVAATTTLSGIRTRSTPGGGAANYNELSFDDAIGNEQVLLHAEKDYVIEVENNETRTIGIGSKTGNRTSTIKGDDSITIGIAGGTGNRTTAIMGNDSITIGGNETRTVTGNQGETVNGSLTLYVTGDLEISAQNITQTARTSETTSTAAYQYDRYFWYGASYNMANYQGGINTNVWAVMANATGVQLNVTGAAVSVTGVSVAYTGAQINGGAFSYSKSEIELKQKLIDMNNATVKLEKDTIQLVSTVIMMIK